jgi:hypothetical protein
VSVKQLPATTNFNVLYEDTIPSSQARAQSIANVCEYELSVLNGWFGIANAFGPNDRINVYLDQPDGTGGYNFGYQGGGVSNIHLDVQSANKSAANAADIVRMIFINELVEIQMDYASQHGGPTWNPGDSAGEGLSQLCGIERFSRGHYLYYSSFVNAWLQSTSRTDWVTTSEATDSNADSFGCALLFLYYLKSQLGHGIADIMRSGGANLEETYHNLTGQAGGFAAFNALVARFFPIGATPSFGRVDNPFPLSGPGVRRVDLTWNTAADGPPTRVADGSADVKAFFFCPGGTYRFSIDNAPQVLTCLATGRGFGQPIYSWRINGVNAVAGNTISINAPISVLDPTNPQHRTSSLSTLLLRLDGGSTWRTSTLNVHVPASAVGEVSLTLEAFAGEKFIDPNTVSSTVAWAQADNETATWEDAYYRDRAECRSRWDDFIDHFSEFRDIDILRTLPDPPPDYFRVVQQLEIISRVLELARVEAPEPAEQATLALRAVLGLSLEGLQRVTDEFNIGR